MLRYYFVIIISLPQIIYYIVKARYLFRHPDRYDELYCYKVARNMVRTVMRNGRIRTGYKGIENLPSEGGYITISVPDEGKNEEAFCKDLFNAFVQAGIPLIQMTTKRPTLEDIFIRLTQEADIGENAEEDQVKKAAAGKEARA